MKKEAIKLFEERKTQPFHPSGKTKRSSETRFQTTFTYLPLALDQPSAYIGYHHLKGATS